MSPPNVASPAKYAAGVLPLSYSVDPATKEKVWKILLLVEWRRLEQDWCIHPFAGKQETSDQSIPYNTAIREFSEETYDMFGDLALKSQFDAHNIFVYMPESRMYLFYALVPYYENIQDQYLKAKEKMAGEQGAELFWYPLDELIEKKGAIRRIFKEKEIKGSKCSSQWFKRPSFADGFVRLKNWILEHPELVKEYEVLAKTSGDVNDLSAALLGTQIASVTQEASSSSVPPKESQ
jgi:hypothetical protein